MAKFKYNTDIAMVQTQYQGWLYEGEGSYFDALPILNRKEAIKKNAKGQVIGADTLLQQRFHSTDTLAAGTTIFRYDITQRYMEMVKHNSKGIEPCAAILAIPATYGNYPNTKEGADNQMTAWRAETWHKNPVFYYYFIMKCEYNVDALKVKFPNPSQIAGQGNYRWIASCNFAQLSSTPDNVLTINKPAGNNRYSATTNIAYRQDFELTIAYPFRVTPMDGLPQLLKNANEGLGSRRADAYDQSYGFIDDGVLASLQTYCSHWEEMENSSYPNIWTCEIPSSLTPSLVSTQKLSSVISSGFPIFELHNFDQMVEYFEGGKWEADNYPIPDDWSTDWNVYVKGAQKPDIFITMKSDKIDEWLASDKNLSGYTKEDISVEYRYREYGKKAEAGGVILPIPDYNRAKYKLLYDIKDTYNKTRETDFMSNIALNYDGILTALSSSSEIAIEKLYAYPCEMEFRIKLDSEHYSAWCRYEIGVIGSPSIPDFSKMNNLGIQDDENLIDSSTVTLHYDEYPDGFDPYPEPEPPTPNPPKPTDPTPSVTGIGLLTETYKITEQQAKELGKFFWGGDTFQKIRALNLSPIENVVGLHYMPINVAGTTDVIVIGDVDTNINGDRIETATPLYTLGSVKIEGRYKNFLDYEPYTSAWIFLPFVGFIRINPVFFTGKTLKVVYTYDLICGLCMAMLYADDIYIESHQGKCGLEIPLVAGNRAQLETALAVSLVTQGLTAAATGGLGTIASVAGIAGSIGSYVENFHSTREGGYTPACAWAETRECFIVIESSNASYTASYNHDFGRPCMATYTIGQLRGFTMIDPNTELSGFDGITDEEMTRLRQILTTGFYV